MARIFRTASLTSLLPSRSSRAGARLIASLALLSAATLLTHANAAAQIAQAPGSRASAGNPPRTAQQVIDAIVKAYGAAPVPKTVDTIKAGDPNTPVTGIATSFMDTFAVLQKAVAAGDNLILTHEPSFYNHVDDRTVLGEDPVTADKLRYIEQHHLVVFRFHDGWHEHQPDGILTGMVEQLGWQAYQQHGPGPDTEHLFTLPRTTVGQLAASLQARLGSPVVRVIGDPAQSVTGAALLPGASGLIKQVKMLQRADVQVLVAGESAEWEGVEYARDAAAEGKKKAFIILGHEPSEEGGMRYLATQLQTLGLGLRIDFIPAGSPFSAVITPAGTWTAPAAVGSGK